MAILNEEIVEAFMRRVASPDGSNIGFAVETRDLMEKEEPMMLNLIELANNNVHPSMGAGLALMWRLIRDSQCQLSQESD